MASTREDGLPREIERKYLLRAHPVVPEGAERLRIEQGWLPGERLRERLRRVTLPDGSERLLRGLKLGRGLERIEIEEPAPPDLFAALWPLTEGCRVRKERFRVRVGALVWEIDRFLDRTLHLAEVELPSRDAPAPVPAWLAPVVVREVTDEPGYTNLELAR